MSWWRYTQIPFLHFFLITSKLRPNQPDLEFSAVFVLLSRFPQLFLEAGNKNTNSFWAANLPPEEEIHSGASEEQRATFVRRKYRERKYRKVLEGFRRLEQLNQVPS